MRPKTASGRFKWVTFARDFAERSRPLTLVLYGYAAFALLGWVALCLPVSEAKPHRALDHLFVAVSAMSTTGLSTIDVGADYSFFGQLVIFGLIQVGGLGYMTLGSFVLLARAPKLGTVSEKMLLSDVSLPSGTSVGGFVRSAVRFTVAVEVCGAIALSFLFYREGVDDWLWAGVFHSVSSFCTAGFSTFGSGMVPYVGNFWINAVILLLALMGAMGFLVVLDVSLRLVGRRSKARRTSRIIVVGTFVIAMAGTLTYFITTKSTDLSDADLLMASGFQMLSAFTTVGFNTIPLDVIHNAHLVLFLLLMVVGGSPAGTGGGLKVTSVVILFAIVRSTLRGDESVCFQGHKIPDVRVRAATASAAFYFAVLAAGVFLLTLVEKQAFPLLLFEATSALGTVGLSMGATGNLSDLGRLVIIGLMFIGRLGVLTLGLALFVEEEELEAIEDDEDIAI